MEPMLPEMSPAPGERAQRFVGDRVRFVLRDKRGRTPAPGWRGVLRTNLGRAESLRREILSAHTRGILPAGSSWRDIQMHPDPEGWSLELALAETGFFRAKAYLLDPNGWQHWPDGPDFGISVHPNVYRTGNVLYCAFARMFGHSPAGRETPAGIKAIPDLDKAGFNVIPPSGKLRDLTRQLPHILGRLGCRILHLLPVNPTPTTYARFGRFGSPYAALDLAAIDPALVELDKRTTGIDQFRELTNAAHAAGARVLLDIVINHTGWGSVLQENHPEWFMRTGPGEFKSPGAWGVTWEDLVELKHDNVELWDILADVFITWCKRGVDGFRCDAGYMVPVPAWQYIVARVQQHYPDTLFLLEGLGGAWSATEALLTDGGMQWAYSELFQNYSAREVSSYLDHSLAKSERVGLLVHYSETHDNNRLAARGANWALMRNQLCALASRNGGFGFTCGVEWLAEEKILVHQRTSLNWGARQNLVEPLHRLNSLLANHPCFFDGAKVTRLSPADSPVLALARESQDGLNHILVMVNGDPAHPHNLVIDARLAAEHLGGVTAHELSAWADLLGGEPSKSASVTTADGAVQFTLAAATGRALAPKTVPAGLTGEHYRAARARAALAIRAMSHVLPVEDVGPANWQDLAAIVDDNPERFFGRLNLLQPELARTNLLEALNEAGQQESYPQVVSWKALDATRITPIPPRHWLLMELEDRFRATVVFDDGPAPLPPERANSCRPIARNPINLESTPANGAQIAFIPPQDKPGKARLTVQRFGPGQTPLECDLVYLAPEPQVEKADSTPHRDDLVLLTNGRGGMARICVDLGRVNSKYDCVLGANLHPNLPVDRHVLAKRIRVWVNADGFISPLDAGRLERFEPGPPARWHFVANAGDGRTVQIDASAEMLEGQNTTVFHFSRPTAADASGKQLPETCDVRLTIRVDIEDRGYHGETHRNPGADYHFSSNTHPLLVHAGKEKWQGFEFTPAPDRQLRVYATRGMYHPQEEWSQNIPQPVEQSRGQVGSGDAVSPGWFEVPLAKGASASLVVTAEIPPAQVGFSRRENPDDARLGSALPPCAFEATLEKSARAFVVQRGAGVTVIAGYPWFLDWGRDTFIAARGLIAAGWLSEVCDIVTTFARFEKDGTLPNTIFGEDASNRDTVDAPLWFGIVCEELAGANGSTERGHPCRLPEPGKGAPRCDIFSTPVDPSGRTVVQILESIARHYCSGTPNGIRMDAASGLIWSPSHFTWMDTNFPACTPREGYPVEIQALWIRLLRLLSRVGSKSERKGWGTLADRALESVEKLFWMEDEGYYADVLRARAGEPALQARVDDALRSNSLFLASLGLVNGKRAQRCVEAAARHLVVPGALRSLAPLPVKLPLPLRGGSGEPLNDPIHPYWGRYEGDEDTRRKPAYHNGTAWVWTLPTFCEALAGAWNSSPQAVAAARAYLGSTASLLGEGCIGQLPEILDGDAPHRQRGCDAQAWSITETLRVWRLLSPK